MELIYKSLIALGLLGVAYIYVYFYMGKGKGKRVRILLFEQVGNDKVYKGYRIGFEKDDPKLGIYFFIKKEEHAISDVRNDDLFYDSEYGKALLVCKYAADDYKVMARLKTGEWAKIVPVLDKDGNETDKLEYLTYEEPLGVTQEDREVARFTSDYRARMLEFRKEKEGLFMKVLPYITVAFVAMTLMLTHSYLSNKNAETQQYIASTFVEGAGEFQEAMSSPSFAESMLKKWEASQMEDNAPVR